ncbi:ELWxxDGT repeat protein [Stieleria marina]|uniref:Probable pectate lyase C n=1 Tax=Stieleria marina TaxID=1930275 RepID=A0A517NNN4_9BACT|nr:HYR domain protein [Planctomycetes bacterium K23_9]
MNRNLLSHLFSARDRRIHKTTRRRVSRRRQLLEQLESRHLLSAVSLVADINDFEDGSVPTEITTVGSLGYFVASDLGHGKELWKTDGTVAGTVRVSDIEAGPADTYISQLTNVDGTLMFSVHDYGTGYPQLWKTDGLGGVMMVKDFSADSAYFLSHPTAVDDSLFFSLYSASQGYELWVSDGTLGGTMLVKDIRPGANGSKPSSLTNVDGTLFFSAEDSTHGRELWKSDGTPGGTVMVRDLNAGTASSMTTSAEIVALGSTAILVADNGTTGPELWKSTGSTVSLVKNINGASASSISGLTTVGSKVFFSAFDNVSYTELWSTEGTSATTVVVHDTPGDGLYPQNLRAVGNEVFFSAYNYSGGIGRELWKSDGTSGGTVLVADVKTNTSYYVGNSSYPQVLGDDGTHVFFSADDGIHGREVWSYDGVAATRITDVNPGNNGSEPTDVTVVGGVPIFSAIDGLGDRELYQTDGTLAGTSLFVDILDTNVSSNPGSLAALGDQVVVVAQRETGPYNVIAIENNGSGFAAVTDQIPSFYAQPWVAPVTSGNRTFFSGYDPANGYELWATDGTAIGTALVKDIAPGNFGSYVDDLTDVNGTLFFTAYTPANGRELWKSDGTAGGTMLVKDIGPGATGGYLSDFVGANSQLFFRAYETTTGYEWWVSDGTSAGTMLIDDLNTGPGSTTSAEAVAAGDDLFFINTSSGSSVLWTSDGSSAGTTSLGPVGLQPYDLAAVSGTVYFSGQDASGQELWKSNGTQSGTIRVTDIVPGSSGSYPYYLTPVGNELFFVGTSATYQHSLFKSDGTAAGTSVVRAFDSSATGDLPSDLMGGGGTLFFAANTNAAGYELWKSDGTAAGTMLIADINPGTAHSNPALSQSTFSGDSLFFTADNGSQGREVWRATANMDFGDAPASFGTLAVDDGARHVYYSTGIRLGVDSDHEADGSPVASALGDDNAGSDDEDGVTIGTLNAGMASTLTIDVTGGADSGLVDAWIDFNQDGTFDPSNERITPAAGAPVSGLANVININVADGFAGPTFLRVRLSSEGGLLPTGVAADGEVEDYAVTVFDITPPDVTAPGSITIEGNITGGADGSATGVAAFLAAATTTDNVDPAASLNNDAASPYLLGDTTVTFTSIDASGNIGNDTGVITVVDTTAPTLTQPADLTIEASSPTGLDATDPAIVAFLSGASTTDIVDPSPSLANNAPATFVLGSTPVEFTSVDASSNTATETANVILVDTTAPSLTVPADLIVEAESPSGTSNTNSVIAAALDSATAADAVDLSPSITHDAPSVFPLGTTTVTFTATDFTGNLTTATTSVTIEDTTPPDLIAPADVTVEAESASGVPDSNAAVVAFIGGAIATDIADPAPTVTDDTPATIPLGSTTVTFTATDATGNQNSASASIIVVDTTAPDLNVPADITLEANSPSGLDATDPAIAAFLAAATANDLVDASPSVTNDSPTTLPLGTTLITFTATDATGNSAPASASITIVDTTAPNLTVPANSTLEANSPTGLDSNDPAIAAFLASANATDAVDISPSVTNDAPSTLPLGTTSVTFIATDASGNSAPASASITIVDTTAPNLNIPPDITLEATSPTGLDATDPAIAAFLAAATATDLVDTSPAVTNDAPSTLPLGTTLITFTATDATGNSAPASASITIVDTTSPNLNIPADITLEANSPIGLDATDPAIAAFLAAANATDAVDTSPSVTNDAPSTLPLGTTLITFTATDATGNSAPASASITIVDTIEPNLTVPADIVVVADAFSGSPDSNLVIAAFLSGATSSDIVDPTPTITNDAPTTLPIGTTIVTFESIDDSGNSASDTASITVIDHRVFIVNHAGDTADAAPGDGIASDASGNTTLRAAVEESNASANILDNSDQIVFDMGAGGPQTILVNSALPNITDAVVIDGTTQDGFLDAPIVQISAAGTVQDGLRLLDHDGSTIQGLSFTGFANDGIEISGGSGHTVTGNWLGIDTSENIIGNRFGLKVGNSTGNTVHDNVISGNTGTGVFVSPTAIGNTLTENKVGTDSTGNAARPNAGAGMNLIGTDNFVVDNQLSGNDKQGLIVSGSGNTVQGNLVGTNAAGSTALGNGAFGIAVQSDSNLIGGDSSAGQGNVISGNTRQGLLLNNADNNIVLGNLVGVDITGLSSIANTSYGIYVLNSDGNQIGGSSVDQANVVSGNGGSGVAFANSQNNTLTGNKIGTDESGQIAVGNNAFGVFLLAGSAGNVASGNQISGNVATGVGLIGSDTTNNTVELNNIGFNHDLTSQLGNGTFAVLVSSPGNLIDTNTITGSLRGVVLTDVTATGNTVSNNSISGMSTGVQFAKDAANNTVGPGNDLSANTTGVRFVGNSGNGNTITQNSFSNNATIGIDLAGPGATANDVDDADEGANRGMNHPVISDAEIIGNNLNVTFNVPSAPANADYSLTIEFYRSDSFGQGEAFLASVPFTVGQFNNSGVTRALGGVAAAAGLLPGDFISATATDAAGNTSEFSAAFQIPVPAASATSGAAPILARSVVDVSADGAVTPADALIVINELSNLRSTTPLGESIARSNAFSAADVNRDGNVTPADLLQVLNFLSEQAQHDSISESNRIASLVDSVFGLADDDDDVEDSLDESLLF